MSDTRHGDDNLAVVIPSRPEYLYLTGLDGRQVIIAVSAITFVGPIDNPVDHWPYRFIGILGTLGYKLDTSKENDDKLRTVGLLPMS